MEGLHEDDPKSVGRYELLRRLGEGGMGQVYLGQSPSGRLVAVKVVRPELADDPDFRGRFAHEVAAARRVSGMFTAPVVDADPDAPQPWMVTAYVPGPSLEAAVTSRGPLSARSIRTLAAGLAEGLGAVHAAGLVHRDLKPSNVLLASDGPRIIDFGISWIADAGRRTSAGRVVGSPGFMSPEQAEGKHIGPPTDVFSLGSVLAFAATGEPPFGSGSASALIYRVVYGEAATGNIPAEVRPLIERCLAKDPAARPSTDELLAELGPAELEQSGPGHNWLGWNEVTIPDGFLPTDPHGHPAPPESAPPEPAPPESAAGVVERRWRRRRPLIGLAAVAAAVAIIAALLAGFGRASDDRKGQPVTGNSPLAGQVSAAAGQTSAAPAATAASDQAAGGSAPAASAGVPPPVAGAPRAVVLGYFTAIGSGDYLRAWDLGGKNLYSSLPVMLTQLNTTDVQLVRIVSVTGSDVLAEVRSTDLLGSSEDYQELYTVRDGEIVSATKQASTGQGS